MLRVARIFIHERISPKARVENRQYGYRTPAIITLHVSERERERAFVIVILNRNGCLAILTKVILRGVNYTLVLTCFMKRKIVVRYIIKLYNQYFL